MMNYYEPLFLLLLLTAVVTLLTAAGFAIAGRFARAGKTLGRLGIGAVVYMTIVIGVTLFSTRQVFQVGEQRCNEDWCITVTDWRRGTGDAATEVEISLRLSSRARRVPMGEKGTVIYLVDARGRRFDPVPDPSDLPFTTVLQPGESRLTKRRFHVPVDARDLGVIYKGEGGFPIGSFIISEGGWFLKPALVPLR